MKKKALTLLLALVLCAGLAAPAFAAEAGDIAITTDDGYTYILSQPIVAVEDWEHDGTEDVVYVIPQGTVITTPDEFDSYSLIYYTPPYTDNTKPAGERGQGTAPAMAMDYIAYMYNSYITMFQNLEVVYRPADISQCFVAIVHYIEPEAEGGIPSAEAAKIFFRNAGAGGTADIPPENIPSPWAADAVDSAINAGLVPRKLRSDYRSPVTRAEICALAVALYENVTEREITGRTKFSDTDDVNVEKMASLGVVTGLGDGRFSPEDKLTREQAATILYRLAAAMGRPLTADDSAVFADDSAISPWAQYAVEQMQATGIMGGVGENIFSPKADFTREQSIVTILRLYNTVK